METVTRTKDKIYVHSAMDESEIAALIAEQPALAKHFKAAEPKTKKKKTVTKK